MDKMVQRKTWEEFRSTGLLLIVNQILHIFGWAIVVQMVGEEITDAFPALVKYRGFDAKDTTESYIKVSKYMKENADRLLSEAEK